MHVLNLRPLDTTGPGHPRDLCRPAGRCGGSPDRACSVLDVVAVPGTVRCPIPDAQVQYWQMRVTWGSWPLSLIIIMWQAWYNLHNHPALLTLVSLVMLHAHTVQTAHGNNCQCSLKNKTQAAATINTNEWGTGGCKTKPASSFFKAGHVP